MKTPVLLILYNRPDKTKIVNEVFDKKQLVVLEDCGNRNFLKRKE
jgi:hypothetical protein